MHRFFLPVGSFFKLTNIVEPGKSDEYIIFFHLLIVNHYFYYCVSLDAVDIVVKLCVCVAVRKPILIVQPVIVAPEEGLSP